MSLENATMTYCYYLLRCIHLSAGIFFCRKSIAAIKDVKKEEVVPNSDNTTKRTINEGITNAAYVDQELSRPSTSRHESTLNSIDIETAITLYSEDDVDFCVWGQPTSGIVASTVNPSPTPPQCIHSGILPTPAPPVIDSGSNVAARPSSLDVSSIVGLPDQPESVLVDDALPQVNGVLRVSYNKDEDTTVVEIDNTGVDNRGAIEDHDDVKNSTEDQSTAEIVNDQAGTTEDNDSNDHLAQCNDDSDTSGIQSADNDSAKTPSSICVATRDDSAVETPASPTAAGNDADDELSDVDDVDLAGVVVNSSFDSTDNTLGMNDVVVDRAARRITIGSLSLEFNVGGRLDEDGNKRSSIVITQSDVDN